MQSMTRTSQQVRQGVLEMNKEKTTTMNKVMTVFGTILCIILIPILVMNGTLIIKSYLHKDEVPSFGSRVPMIVLTDSMYPEIESGDLIICKQKDPKEVKVGDIIRRRLYEKKNQEDTEALLAELEVLRAEKQKNA